MRTNELIELAYEAHSGQEDKGQKPYILNPWRMSLNVFSKAAKLDIFCGVSESTFHKAVKACIAHDLIEDTDITLDYLRERGLSEEIIDALDCLTRREGESYPDFIERCKSNVISWIAKVCDIVDNLDSDRIPIDLWSTEDDKRIIKYRRALKQLEVLDSELMMLLTYH